MKLTEAQGINLRWLVQRGGSGYLDKHGRVVAGGEHRPQGSWISWLHLIANGLIAGGESRLTVTEYGMRHANPTIAKAASPNDAGGASK